MRAMNTPTTPVRRVSLRVYLAAPFADAPQVRELDETLEAMGIEVTSTWAHGASGAEQLDVMDVEAVRSLALTNDRNLATAHLLVALARDGAGAEMFAEVRLALAHRIPVLWVGTRRPLSAYREGVLRVATRGEATLMLTGFAEITAGVPKFEVRAARETLWELIEALHERAGARSPRPTKGPVKVA
jgi:hypothetical protein